MLSPQANLRLLQRTSWSGYVCIAFLMVGIWPLARFFPSQPPSWDAAQITRIYHDNTAGIRLGMVLVLVGSMFYVPWTAMLAKLIAAVEGKPGILTFCQIIAGCTNVLLTAYPAGWWLTASFRSDRDPRLVQLLNDVAWLQFLDVALAKARGRLDYADMSKAAPLDTESARAYARRALSAELDSYLCEPIVGTMLIADTDKVSKVELLSGIGNIFTSKILAAVGGQGRLPEALAGLLKVRLQTPVTEVRRAENWVRVSYPGTTSDYDACVITCPLPEATAICVDDRSILGPLNNSLGYTRCISVAVGTARPPDCPAFLVMFPSVEDPDIALMFLDHNKAPDRAPAGHGLLSCLWETGASERMIDASDEQLVDHTLASLFAVFPELRGTVEFTHVTRWRRALPFTRIGAYQDIGRLNAALDPASSVQYAADFMSAPGQNTAVEFGNRAARNLIGAI